MRELWRVHNKKFRYLAAGFWNTVFGYGSFAILCRLCEAMGIHYLFALTVSQILGTTNSFLSFKHFVFKTKGGHLREYFRFSLVYWIIFVGNLFVLPALVNGAHIGPILAQGLIMPVTVVAGYLVHERFSFKTHQGAAAGLVKYPSR